MTVEEYKSVAKECGFNTVEEEIFIFTILGNHDVYYFSYYDLKQNEIRIVRNVITDIDKTRILPSEGNDKYSVVNLNKEYYRNRMMNLQKEIKKLKIELKRNELEKDFI